MARSLWALPLLTLGALSQPRSPAQEPEVPTRMVTVTPAAAPEPALRYKLLPEVRDTTPGNAALLYYRAFSPDWSQHVRGNKDVQEKLEAALDKPPAEVKAIGELAFLRDWVMLKEVDRAARRAYCDWEIIPRVLEEGVGLLLPDVQGTREFARYLKLRAKLELADRQFDRAARTIQTGMQLGRHVADAPTLIQALVGSAITAIMLTEVEEWVTAPGSPNLYWALSTLPQPYISLRKPMQGERLFLDSLLPGVRAALAGPPAGPIATDQLQGFVAKLGQLDSGGPPSWAVVAVVAKKYGPAKAFLLGRGWTAGQVDALPALQVVLMREVADYDRLFDEMNKWQGQPYWIARPGLERAERQLKDEVSRGGGPGLSLAGLLLPAISKVHLAGARTDRTIHLLRTVEAVRMYAAAQGRLPASLADLTVPVPTDPITGQPFEYRVTGDAAVLTAPPPAGEKPYEGNSRRYEIRLAR